MSLPEACWTDSERDVICRTRSPSGAAQDTVTGTVTATLPISCASPSRMVGAAADAAAAVASAVTVTAARTSTFLNIAPPSGGIGTSGTLDPGGAAHIGQMPEIGHVRCPIFGRYPAGGLPTSVVSNARV